MLSRLAIYSIAATAFIVFGVTSGFAAPGGEQGRIQLKAEKSEDTARAIPGSSLYAAELFNNGKKSLVLQAVQMPGGYAGEGKFFACSLDAWHPARHRWTPLWSAESGPSSSLRDVTLNPGGHMRVCGLMLPAQAGRDGQCVRFRVRVRWNESSQTGIASNSIVIGDQPATAGPCRTQE